MPRQRTSRSSIIPISFCFAMRGDHGLITKRSSHAQIVKNMDNLHVTPITEQCIDRTSSVLK